MSHAELQCISDFSFLEGASCAEELFAQAAAYGIEALAIADRNTLSGIVRAHQAAKIKGVRLIVGCRIDLACGASLLVYPLHRAGYGRLCRLLSLGKSRAGKGKCRLEWDDVAAHAEGLVAVLVPEEADDGLADRLGRLKEIFGAEAYLALSRTRRQDDRARLQRLESHAKRAGVKTIATGNVMFHAAERRVLQGVMTCIRLGCTIDELGFRRERTADRHLLPPAEIERLFADHPGALRRARELASRLRFSLDELRYQYPKEIVEPGLSPQESLTRLTYEAAEERYPNGIPLKVQRALAHELRLIAQLDYAPYFLTVHSIVRHARVEKILCQGRGSAANSAVCFVLGITSIDPTQHDLLFERFVSAERNEPPDIDVDFEHQRREEVIQWIYDTYGRHRAALCSAVVRYRGRGALRDVGKALGLPEDLIHGLSRQVSAWSAEGVTEELAKELNLPIDHRLHMAIALARQLMGFPRHLSQHVGGFVLTHDRLDELVPIEPARMDDRQIIEWDKDDIDVLKFMKVDVLALGMLSCLKYGLDLLKEHKGLDYDLASIPQEDKATYDMICEADTLGVFQIESRAQMNMLPRLLPRTLYDLVVEVAIVRPGPIQGDMVHPYLKRRQGIEKVDLPTDELRQVLGKTLGIPLFQEQAMQVAIVCAGFTPGEADQLRRSMATFKYTGGVSQYHDRLIDGMVAKGYERDFAIRIFKQLEGFGSYGFPESHAASFALLAYVSSWLKCHHPDVFCCALLNAQPMGFYAPAQIVRDAAEHAVEIRPICINASRWDSTLEPTNVPGRFAVRLGMRLAKSLSEAHASRIESARHAPYESVEEVWRRAGVPAAPLRHLAAADAFLPSLGLSRRDALWAVKGLRDEVLPLFAQDDGPESVEPVTLLRPMTAGREVVEDYHRVGLSLRLHPVAFLRRTLAQRGMKTCAEIAAARDGQRVEGAGLVLVRQKPGSAKGVMFITIEDETGIANLVVWPKIYERLRRLILTVGMIGVEGRIQRAGKIVHLVVEELTDLSAELASIAGIDHAFPVPYAHADVVTGGGGHDTTAFSSRRLDIPLSPASESAPIRVKTRDFR